MRRVMVGVLILFGLMIGGSTCIAGVSRCSRVAKHVQNSVQLGDLPMAKLFIDLATEDVGVLGCTADDCATLAQLQRRVYVAYALDLVRMAREDINIREDGRSAIRKLLMASDAVGAVGLELANINSLSAAALFCAGCQELADADAAEQSGDLALRDELRAVAKDSFLRALRLDSRVAKLIRSLKSAPGIPSI